MFDSYAYRRLAASVVNAALHDAEKGTPDVRIEALAWLASKSAGVYLDILDIHQSALLMKSGWIGWTDEVMIRLSTPRHHARTITHALVYLKDLEQKQHANQRP